MKNRTMFISSMARKNHERSKSTGTSINESYFAGHHDVAGKKKGSSSFDINGYENPCGVFVSGLQEQIRKKKTRYRTNSEKTIRTFQKPVPDTPPNATVHVPSNSSFNDYYREFSKKRPKNKNLSDMYDDLKACSSDKDWYLDPIHRRTHDINSFTKLRLQNATDHPVIWDEGMLLEEEDNINMNLFRAVDSTVLKEHTKALNGISPYEVELSRLRYEKLKIEEAYLLKLKCDEELERTRGPVKKWYELKTKEFTTEMEKYTNRLKDEKSRNELLDYRNSLKEVSRDWENLRH